ncbi:MAG: OprO/OprP family phosphate-selective porin, partial [Planctomycetaceae bacterium]
MSRMFRGQQAGMAAFAIAIAVCGNLFGQQYSDVFKRSYAAADGSEAIIGDYQPLDVTAAAGGQLPESAAEGSSDQRLDELEKMVRDLRDKANKKTLPSVTINGVFQADVGWVQQDLASRQKYGDIQDGADFRRARLSAKGSVTETTNYFFQMDFGFFGRPTFTDVWVEQTQVPLLGNVRIGQWKQPFGLEVVSSFRYTTFMERSSLFQAFTPFRHMGIGFYDHTDELDATWAASVFRSGQDQFGGTLTDDGGWGTAERVTMLPMWEDDGQRYLHLGAGHFFNAPSDETVNFRTIPEFYIGANGPGAVGTSGQAVPGGANGTPFFLATGNLNLSSYNGVGSELLWVDGPVSLQSEAMVTMCDFQGQSCALPGMYAQAGWFLTGEHRPYDRKLGTIDRVIPKENFGYNAAGGAGAWEVAARFSWLDLSDTGSPVRQLTSVNPVVAEIQPGESGGNFPRSRTTSGIVPEIFLR